MKKNIIILSLLTLLATALLMPNSELCLAKEIPQCSCVPAIYYDAITGHRINRDSAFVFDTCGAKIVTSSCDSSFSLCWRGYLDAGYMKTKDRFWIMFDFPAIKLPKYPSDTIIYVHWQSIDTIYIIARQKFQELETQFGAFKLKKINQTMDTGIGSQDYFIEFEDWVSVRGVLSVIKYSIPNFYCELRADLSYGSSDGVDEERRPQLISPNPAGDFIFLNKGLQPIVPAEQIKIYNTYGECVISLETGLRPVSTKIDVSALPAGVYFVRWGDRLYKFIKI